jgi:hypothetical protein
MFPDDFAVLPGLSLHTPEGLVPEEKEQDDDRDWNTEQP